MQASHTNGINELTAILDRTLQDGGGTFSRSGVPVPTSGYAVGVLGSRALRPRHRAADLAAFAARYSRCLTDPEAGYYLGTWIDPDGVWIADVVAVIPRLADALALAAIHGQDCVFDLATGRKYPTPTGTPTA